MKSPRHAAGPGPGAVLALVSRKLGELPALTGASCGVGGSRLRRLPLGLLGGTARVLMLARALREAGHGKPGEDRATEEGCRMISREPLRVRQHILEVAAADRLGEVLQATGQAAR